MMESAVPMLHAADRELLDAPNPATVATLGPDGSPQLSVVFVGRDDDAVLFTTTTTRAKTRNLLRDPRVSVLVYDAANVDRYVEIRGRTEIVPDPLKSLLVEMFAKYLVGATPPPEPGVERVIVRVIPEKVIRHPVPTDAPG